MTAGPRAFTGRRVVGDAGVDTAGLGLPIAGGLVVIFVLAALAAIMQEPVIVGAAAAAAAVAGLVLVIVRPTVATILVLVLVYSNAPVVGAQVHGVPYVLAALVPALLLLPIAERLLLGRGRLRVPPTMPFVLGFLLVEVISTLLSRDVGAASTELGRVIGEGVLLYILIVNAVMTRGLLRAAIVSLVVVATALSLMTIVQQVGGASGEMFLGFARIEGEGFDPGTGAAIQARAGGPIGEQNFYAQMLMAVLPLAFTLVRIEHGIARLAAVAASLVIATAIALTYSRGAAVAGILLVPALLAMRVIGARGLLALSVAAVVVLTAIPNYSARLTSLEGVTGAVSETGETDPVIAQRANDILAAALVFAEHPVLGVGPGQFRFHYREYADRVGGRPGDADYAAHNLYAEVASEGGILGLLTFGGIIVTTLVALLRGRRAARGDPALVALADGFVLVIIVFLATGLFLHIAYQRYIWTFLALAISAAMIVRASADLPEPPPSSGPDVS